MHIKGANEVKIRLFRKFEWYLLGTFSNIDNIQQESFREKVRPSVRPPVHPLVCPPGVKMKMSTNIYLCLSVCHRQANNQSTCIIVMCVVFMLKHDLSIRILWYSKVGVFGRHIVFMI